MHRDGVVYCIDQKKGKGRLVQANTNSLPAKKVSDRGVLIKARTRKTLALRIAKAPRKELTVNRDMTLCGRSIEVNGVVVGVLQLLGSELESGALHFMLSSNGTIPALTYICEGVFEEVVHLVDESGNAGNIFIGKRFVEKTPALEPFSQKICFLEQLARHIAHKVEAQQPKASQ